MVHSHGPHCEQATTAAKNNHCGARVFDLRFESWLESRFRTFLSSFYHNAWSKKAKSGHKGAHLVSTPVRASSGESRLKGPRCGNEAFRQKRSARWRVFRYFRGFVRPQASRRLAANRSSPAVTTS